MYFVSDAHKQFYEDHEDIRERGQDYDGLIYTLGISGECRSHFHDLFNEKTGLIITEGISKGWQTQGSRNISRLAFNLFTYGIPEEDAQSEYTPKVLLSGLDEDHRTGAIYAMMYYA